MLLLNLHTIVSCTIFIEKCRTRRKKDYKKKETRTVNVSPFGFIRTTERELEEVEGS